MTRATRASPAFAPFVQGQLSGKTISNRSKHFPSFATAAAVGLCIVTRRSNVLTWADKILHDFCNPRAPFRITTPSNLSFSTGKETNYILASYSGESIQSHFPKFGFFCKQ